MILDTTKNPVLCKWLTDALMADLCGEVELDDAELAANKALSEERFPNHDTEWHGAHAAWMILTKGRVSKETATELGLKGVSDLQRFALASEAQNKAFKALYQQQDENARLLWKTLDSAPEEYEKTRAVVKDRTAGLARLMVNQFSKSIEAMNTVELARLAKAELTERKQWRLSLLDWAWKITVLGLLTLFAVRGNAQNVVQLRFGSTTLGAGYIDTGNTAIEVSCVVGCSGGTTDTDDGSVASGQSTGIQIGLGYVYNGAAWVRMIGDATNGLTVQCATGCSGGTQYTEDAVAAANPIGSAINLVRQDTPAGLVSTDGDNVAQRGTNYGAAYVQVVSSAGAFVDTFGGGTQYAVDAALGATPTGTLAIAIRDDALSALTPVEGDAIGLRVDANGALWVIPSGTTIVGDGAGALNVIVDSGSITANAGTNLNTSLLALEAGGNLATVAGDTTDIETAVELIDDSVATLGTTTYLEATTKGLFAAAVRRDADTSAVNTDNEAAPLLVNAIGALKVEIFDGGDSHTVDGTVTVTDGAGALNVIVDSGTLTAVTTITNAVTVTDGAGALNVICDSGCAGGTQYTEDAVAAADPVGTALNMVRADALAAVTTTDGDNVAARGTNKGELYVKHVDAIPITDNAGSLTVDGTVTITDGAGAVNVICDSGCGGPATFADNAAFTFGTTSIGITGYVFDDVAVNAATENSAAAPRMASNRVPYGIIRDGAGNERGANVTAGNALVVDGSAVTQPVSGTFWQATQPVSAASLPLPTGASTLAEQQTQTTALQLIDDGVYTDDTSTHATGTSKGYGIMAVAAPTDAAVNANDIGMVGMNVDRELYVAVSDPLPAGTNNIGDVDVLSFPDNEPINVAQINGVAVTMGNGISGTGVQRVTIASDSTGLVSVSESTAEDVAAAAAERLVRIGCVGNDADGTPFTTSGTDGDYTHVACDRNGALMVTGQHPDQWSYHENSSSALTDTTVNGACGAGLFNYITSITFSTGAATAASVLIEESTTTTILGPYYLEAVNGRGLHIPFPTPKKQTTANTLISVTTTGAIAHGLDIIGFCAP